MNIALSGHSICVWSERLMNPISLIQYFLFRSGNHPFKPQWLKNAACVMGLVSACVLLSGCYGGDLETQTASFADLRSDSTGNVKVELVRLDGTDSDGSSAHMVFSYAFVGGDPENLPAGAALVLTVFDTDGNILTVSDPLPLDLLDGEVTLAVPTVHDTVTAVATIELPGAESDQPAQPQGVLEVNTGFELEDTDLSTVESISAVLVPDSYTSERQGLRRLHRFAVQVFDQECVSVTGLEKNMAYHFRLQENGQEDVESPVEVDSRDNKVNVFLVLDASYSIRHARAEGDVKNAVSHAVLNLPNDYSYDYRQFTGDIKKINNVSEYQADDSVSATALYYAIDTVLDDIKSRGNTDDINVIIGFTDGRDLASANHYQQNFQHDDVKRYIRDKLRDMRLAASNQGRAQSGPTLHMISLGEIGQQEIDHLAELTEAGNGKHYHASQRSMLEPEFKKLAKSILSTYQLEYNSQQATENNKLDLFIRVNDQVPSPVDFPDGIPVQIRGANGQGIQGGPGCQVSP